MHVHGSHAEASVAFVGHQNQTTRFCRNKIRAGDDRLGVHVFLAQVIASTMRDRLRIIIVILGNALAQKRLRNVATVLVNDGLDDVRWLIVIELNDELTEVGLEAFNAIFDEERIEVNFLCRHRLRFRQLRDAVRA